jgi:hypothetical protein
MAVTLSEINKLFIIPALVAMEGTLVASLTAMPTKITIPVFFLGIAMDISIVVVSVLNVI